MSNPIAFSTDSAQFVSPMELTQHNTLGLTCHAKCVFTLTSLKQLPEITKLARESNGVLVLGGGSNVVLPTELDHLVVHVALKGIHCVSESEQASSEAASAWRVDVAAGENWHDWVKTATQRGWSGLENLALIPGTVGAAPVQNIGAYGVELQDRIESVTAWHIPEGRMVTFTQQACEFAYRDSVFKRAAPGTWLIVSVRFLLPRAWKPVLNYPDLRNHKALCAMDPGAIRAHHILDAVCEIRRAKLPDPAVLGNAGSFFKNPVISADQCREIKDKFPDVVAHPHSDNRFKLAAGWLIERCGWKGKRAGAVGVHDRQALVLVNFGGADAAELLELAQQVRQSVRSQFGVELEIEPIVVSKT